jgi:hypothetical protein
METPTVYASLPTNGPSPAIASAQANWPSSTRKSAASPPREPRAISSAPWYPSSSRARGWDRRQRYLPANRLTRPIKGTGELAVAAIEQETGTTKPEPHSALPAEVPSAAAAEASSVPRDRRSSIEAAAAAAHRDRPSVLASPCARTDTDSSPGSTGADQARPCSHRRVPSDDVHETDRSFPCLCDWLEKLGMQRMHMETVPYCMWGCNVQP